MKNKLEFKFVGYIKADTEIKLQKPKRGKYIKLLLDFVPLPKNWGKIKIGGKYEQI